jgi:hypothetical protein
MLRILILYHSVHTKSPNYGIFGSQIIPKNNNLFFGIFFEIYFDNIDIAHK